MNTNPFLIIATVLLFCTSCTPDPPRTTPDGQSSAPAAPSAKPAEPMASAAPTPTPERPTATGCLTAAESMNYAKPHKSAEPPFTDCAAGVFAHCSDVEGERGHLCSRPLDVNATIAARKTKPNSCCYRRD